jgi:hypothetical protein
MNEGSLPLKDARHIGPKRLRAEQDQSKKHKNLKHTYSSHWFLSKLLRFQQGINQVGKQPNGSNPGNDVVHVVLLELVASLRKHPAPEQKHTTHGEVEQIK